MGKIGRNDLCPCGSGKKYKKCCIEKGGEEGTIDTINYSIYNDYASFGKDWAIAIVPVKGFSISEKYTINEISIYPKGTINEKELSMCKYDFSFEECKEKFYDAVLIVFPIKNKRPNMLGTLIPSEKNKLIKTILETSEDIMNIFRYISSNFDKVSNLPQRAGYIDGFTSGLLLYYPQLSMSDYITDKYHVTNISIGIGLDINVSKLKVELDKYFLPIKHEKCVVGSIIKHAFRLYSDILYMPTATNKFMQAMSLMEYLANPFEYEKMQTVKTKIIPFSADSDKQYTLLSERFKYLTSLEDSSGKQIGLRTSIIHNGKNLDQLLDKDYQIDLLLREIQKYICNFINAIVELSDKDWNCVVTKTNEKSKEIRNVRVGYEGKVNADTIIVIDFEFLNKAIEEVFIWYPQHRNKKFNIGKFIYLLLIQADIDRNSYQIPIQIIYKNNTIIFGCDEVAKINELEMKGFDSPLGETSIYTLDAGENYNSIMIKLLDEYLIERNYYVDCSAIFNKIIWISDRNNIPDDVFIRAEKSCKNIILGRLDNKRTTCYDLCIWFDIQLVIMQCLDIEYYEECIEEFLFKIEDGKYAGA